MRIQLKYLLAARTTIKQMRRSEEEKLDWKLVARIRCSLGSSTSAVAAQPGL